MSISSKDISFSNVDLRQAVKNLDSLPAMPVIAQRLLSLNMNTEEGEREMLMLIGQDPQISAKIIGLSNSAIFGTAHKASSLREATIRLGMSRVQSVSSGIAIMSLRAVTATTQFKMQELWLHNFGIAFAMLGIARAMPAKMRPNDDQIFLAGMLHDIGYLALAYLDPQRSDDLHICLAENPELPSLTVEWDMLEICHDELGSELARHWNLPEEIITVLRYHHTPDLAEAAPGQPLVRMINLAEKLLPSFGILEFVSPTIESREWEALGIDPNNADEIAAQVAEQAEQAVQFASSFS